jgi:hypothetical protein
VRVEGEVEEVLESPSVVVFHWIGFVLGQRCFFVLFVLSWLKMLLPHAKHICAKCS